MGGYVLVESDKVYFRNGVIHGQQINCRFLSFKHRWWKAFFFAHCRFVVNFHCKNEYSASIHVHTLYSIEIGFSTILAASPFCLVTLCNERINFDGLTAIGNFFIFSLALCIHPPHRFRPMSARLVPLRRPLLSMLNGEVCHSCFSHRNVAMNFLLVAMKKRFIDKS